MKMDKRYRPELCVSTDDTRYNLSEPYFDAGERKVIATDGRMLVAIPAEPEKEGEESGFKSRGQLTLARDGESELERWGKAKFPDWRPAVKDAPEEGAEGTASVSLDARFLLAIAKALGAEPNKPQVILTFRVDAGQATIDPIRVRVEESEGEGYLMPVCFTMRRPEPKAEPVKVEAAP
jgi:hypothetical protein